jgi:hypothetical protein
VLALGVPALCLAPWLALVYGVIGRPTTMGGGPQGDIFLRVAPQMVEQLFTLPVPLALAVLAGLIGAAGAGLWRGRGLAERDALLLLGVWLGLGTVVLLVYSAMPGASNNPRVLIPVLPALCLLAARGLLRIGGRPRVYGVTLLLALFLAIGAQSVVFQTIQARVASRAMPAWEVLRGEPRGAVLTEHYWHAALYARQPATWFEHDPAFERAIMHDAANFRRYLAAHPIRYVVLPRVDDGMRALRAEPLTRLYERLPIGRELGWREGPVAAPEVRAYLEQQFRRRDAGDHVIFYVRP